MIVRAAASLFLVLFLIPIGIGCAWIPGKNRTVIFLGGLFASLTIFELFQLLFHVTGQSLRLMTLLWCILCGGIALWGLYKNGGKVLGSPTRRKWSLTRLQTLLWVLGVALVAAQILHTTFNTFYGNWDDETYCTNAVSSWYSDMVNRYNPAMGLFQDAFYDKKYTVAGWPIYSSMLAVLTGIHPAIVYRTVLPLFEIPLAYLALWLIVRHIFKEEKTKALLAFIYLQLFNVAAAESMSSMTQEWWLVADIWSGKALAFNIMTPLILWLLLELEECQDSEERKPLWRTLFFACGTSCLIAASLYMTVPIELALWGMFYLWRTKRWKDIGHFLACGMPVVLCALFVTR